MPKAGYCSEFKKNLWVKTLIVGISLVFAIFLLSLSGETAFGQANKYYLVDDGVLRPSPGSVGITSYLYKYGSPNSISWQTSLNGDISGDFTYNIIAGGIDRDLYTYGIASVEFILVKGGTASTLASAFILPEINWKQFQRTLHGTDPSASPGDILQVKVTLVNVIFATRVGIRYGTGESWPEFYSFIEVGTSAPPDTTPPVIWRLWGPTSADTAIAISQKGWPLTSSAVIVARDDYFTDALAGGPLAQYVSDEYAFYSAPILLTNPNHLTNETRAEIQRLGTLLGSQKIYMLGGPGALSPQVEESLRQISTVKEVRRLWGYTSYGTALAIKEEMVAISNKLSNTPKPDTAIITSGENFPDALAISGPAGHKYMPILLVKPFTSEPQPETKLALQGIKQVIIVGGPGAVHPDLERWLNNNGYTVIKRLWGNSEYDTAIDVISSGDSIFGFDKTSILVTRGDYFADALSGGSFAFAQPPLPPKPAVPSLFPVVLVKPDSIPPATNLWLSGNKNEIQAIYVLGGPGAISEGTVGQIEGVVK